MISAKSGVIHYTEGEVYLSGKPITPKRTEFLRVQDGEILRTGSGRAEILLTPGVFLRLSENSEMEMDSADLSDSRVELLSGTALMEVGEMDKAHSLTLTVAGAKLDFRKKGLFRINAGESPSVNSFDGEVMITHDGQNLTLKEGRETSLKGVLMAEKFDKDDTDSFYRWAGRRAGYTAAANISAAKSVFDSGSVWNRGGWYFNQWMGMYTYLPGSGSYYSPFGYSYYSPSRIIGAYYAPRQVWYPSAQRNGGFDAGGGTRGYSGMTSSRSAGAYGGGGMSGAAPSAPAPSAPMAAPRGSDGGGARGAGTRGR